MVETIFHKIIEGIALIPFTGPTWFLISIIMMIIWLFSKASKNPNSVITWEDLVVDTTLNRASPYKLGYLIGMVVGTWVVMNLTDKNLLTFDILGMYFTYLIGATGWSTYITSKTAGK